MAAQNQAGSLPDSLEGVPSPRETDFLVGHRAAERILLESWRSGRMHHAWLFCGPRGIGKATLAFRLARFVMANSAPQAATLAVGDDLGVPADHPAARRIATGVHPDVLHLARAWDERGKRFRSEISVDVMRRAIPFLGSTAGEGGWRVVVVDAADEMNRSAANALLKSLEEPPPRVLFVLVAATPGRLPPTILSRCRRLSLDRLSDAETEAVLDRLGAALPSGPDRDLILSLAEGSPRRALELAGEEGAALYRLLLAAMAGEGRAAAALADRTAEAGGAAFRRTLDLLSGYAARRVRSSPEPLSAHAAPPLPLVTWAELWEKAARSSREVETYNLDRKQFVLDLLETHQDAVRRISSPSGR